MASGIQNREREKSHGDAMQDLALNAQRPWLMADGSRKITKLARVVVIAPANEIDNNGVRPFEETWRYRSEG